MHPEQGFFKDDTALNLIQLICSDENGNETAKIQSDGGALGHFYGLRSCMRSQGRQFFATQFRLKVHHNYIHSSDLSVDSIVAK